MSQATLQAKETRISVANLVRLFTQDKGRIECRIGVFNPTLYKRGEKLLQPFGGGAELTHVGRKHAIEYFGAKGFPNENPKTHRVDARFVVPTEMAERALSWLADLRSGACEVEVLRELKEELADREFDDVPPILTQDEACHITAAYCKTVMQPPAQPGIDTSPNALNDVETRRVFHLHDVTVPIELMATILESPVTRLLTIADLRTTEGGTKRGVTHEGIALGNNFWLY